MTALELFQALESNFKIKHAYKVSFNKNLSQDALDIIQHLKGDLNAEDIVPTYPTSLNIVVFIPGTEKRPESIQNFYQDSNSYMDAFDKEEFRKFADVCLGYLDKSETLN